MVLVAIWFYLPRMRLFEFGVGVGWRLCVYFSTLHGVLCTFVFVGCVRPFVSGFGLITLVPVFALVV